LKNKKERGVKMKQMASMQRTLQKINLNEAPYQVLIKSLSGYHI